MAPFLAKWGSNGSADGQFNDPRHHHRLLRQCLCRRYLQLPYPEVHPPPAPSSYGGTSGSADGEFSYPPALLHRRLCNVYVTDMGNNRIKSSLYWHLPS